MGYGNRIREALLGLDDRYASAVGNFTANHKWSEPVANMRGNVSLKTLIDEYPGASKEEQMQILEMAAKAVGTRYLAPVTGAGLSLYGLTQAMQGQPTNTNEVY